jgi:23S rRNA pseudouridine1911/1915/1917 synthase
MNAMPTTAIVLSARIPDALGGQRLDRVAALLFPAYSRSVLQDWIRSGQLTVDGKICKTNEKYYAGTLLSIAAQQENHSESVAEDLPLDIVYEDEELLVINKPAGLVVHPAAGNHSGTLMNAILYHHLAASLLPRAGIVHRLDKDTTGLMVVAKTLPAHHSLVKQLQKRTIKRDYQAIVHGSLTGGGKVEQPIGRHPHHRTKMAVEPLHGKYAVTHYRIKQRFPGLTLLDLSLETGRTHQIRVHMSHIRHPIVGDTSYAGRTRIPEGASPELAEALKAFPRQALHAWRLGLVQPSSGDYLEWETGLPEDMQRLLAIIQQDANEAKRGGNRHG